jgi:hypothetical protein
VFGGLTTTTTANLTLNGSDTLVNSSNGGSMTVSSGQTVTMTRLTNTSGGRLTVAGTANVSDFVSNGQLTVPAGGMVVNGSSSLVLGGGSTTFVGTPANPGGVINTGPQPLLVRGGLLVNNGVIGNDSGTGQVVVDFGGFAKGAGFYDTLPQTINGGRFSPGNSPGRVHVASATLGPGGTQLYQFEINDAAGVAGPTGAPNLGWDLTLVSHPTNPAVSTLTVTATPANPFVIDVFTLAPFPPDTPGQMANFVETQSYMWLAFDVHPQGQIVNWDPAAIRVDRTNVQNFASGVFGIQRTGNQIFVTYTPVPEPAATLAVLAAGLAAAVRLRRRMISCRHRL